MAFNLGWKEILGIAVIACLALQVTGYYDFTTLIPGNTGGGGLLPDSNYVDTEATITWVLMDQYGGSGLSSKSIAVYEGSTLQESCTTASTGIIATARTYQTGEELTVWIDDGNAHYAIPVTVPQMLKTTAEGSSPTFRIELKGWTVNTFTDAAYIAAVSLADGDTFNHTSNSTSTLKYTWSGVTDNRAVLATGFNDPLTGPLDDGVGAIVNDPRYNCRTDIVCFIVTNVTTINFENVDGSYLVGSSKVFYKTLNSEDFIKYKVGNTYVREGAGTVSFPMDATGATSANASIQLYIFGGADVAYAIAHSASGSTATAYGPDAYQLCEQTLVADTNAA